MDKVFYKKEITRLQEKIVSRNKKISDLETALQKHFGLYAIWKIYFVSIIFKIKKLWN